MRRQTFLSGGLGAYFAYTMLALPSLFALSVAINGLWWATLVGPAASYILYAIGLHRYIRLIILKDGRIKAMPSLTPIDQLQYKVDVSLSEVVTATYGFHQGDTKGNPRYRAWDLPCLRLTLRDESVEVILLLGYMKEQIESLEKAIKKENGNIVFTNDSRAIFMFFK